MGEGLEWWLAIQWTQVQIPLENLAWNQMFQLLYKGQFPSWCQQLKKNQLSLSWPAL